MRVIDESDGKFLELLHALVQIFVPHEELLGEQVGLAYARGELFEPSSRSDPLGMGVGDVYALACTVSVLLAPVAEWALKDVAAKAVADVAIEKIKKLLKPKTAQEPAPSTSTQPQADTLRNIGALEIKLADSLLDHMRQRGRKLGLSDERVTTLHAEMARTIIPIFSSAIQQGSKAG